MSRPPGWAPNLSTDFRCHPATSDFLISAERRLALWGEASDQGINHSYCHSWMSELVVGQLRHQIRDDLIVGGKASAGAEKSSQSRLPRRRKAWDIRPEGGLTMVGISPGGVATQVVLLVAERLHRLATGCAVRRYPWIPAPTATTPEGFNSPKRTLLNPFGNQAKDGIHG